MTFNLFRKTLSCLAGVAALSFCSTLAGASLITYDLTGATTTAGALTGTVTLDNLTGRVTAADITFNDSLVGNPVFTSIGSPNSYNNLGQDYISGPSDSPLNYGGQIALYYDLTNLAGGGNLNICLSVGACGTESNQASYVQAYVSNSYGGPFLLTAGSLDPEGSLTNSPSKGAAVTAEPASLILLGTGMAALAVGMTRSKKSHV
jgi:hypothetical protein